MKVDGEKHANAGAMRTGIAIGIGIGVAIGAGMHNIGAGIAVGVAIGVALNASMEERRKLGADGGARRDQGDPQGAMS